MASPPPTGRLATLPWRSGNPIIVPSSLVLPLADVAFLPAESSTESMQTRARRKRVCSPAAAVRGASRASRPELHDGAGWHPDGRGFSGFRRNWPGIAIRPGSSPGAREHALWRTETALLPSPSEIVGNCSEQASPMSRRGSASELPDVDCAKKPRRPRRKLALVGGGRGVAWDPTGSSQTSDPWNLLARFHVGLL